MGLLDILNGMQNGPRGPSTSTPGKGGMSPLTMALLALLAYKAAKHIGVGQPNAAPAGDPAPTPLPTPSTPASLPGGIGGSLGGGLGDLMKGGLGGLLAGGAAGSVLSGGLGDLLKQFQDSGHGETANSWVSPGPNKAIDPSDLANALGADQINAAMSQSGLSREELLQGLSKFLPDAVNHMTPDGRLPTEHEASNLL